MPLTRRAPAAAALAAATLATLAPLTVLGGAAQAATCPTTMTFRFDPRAGGAVLEPATLTVDAGSCVNLQNQTITPVDFTVGTFRRTVAGFDATQYPATAAGTTQPVSANGAAGSARGSIVIRPRPAPSPTASHSSPAAPARPSVAPRPSPTGSSAAPAAASSPTPSARPSAPAALSTPGPLPSASGSLAAPAPSAPSVAPSATPASSAPAVVAGPLQPPTDRGTGLPAALAALGVVATAGGLLRVLLAEPVRGRPVDGRDSVGAAV